MRGASVLVALLIAGVVVPSAAWAFWTTSGVGAGTAATGTLDAPTDVRADVSGADVTITWTSPTQAYPAPTVAYVVQDDGGSTVCSAASPTATSCSFTASTGTFRYAVSAEFQSWTAVSDLSDPVTVTPTPTATPSPTPSRTSSPTAPDASARTPALHDSTDDGAAAPTSSAEGADESEDPAVPADDGVPVTVPSGGTATDPAASPTAE